MFCPQCGSTPSEDLKFCNKCGTNLFAVRQVVTSRETEEKFDWNKTWLTEMFLTHSERRKRHQEVERKRGITPEIKRYTEIKAGVITSSVGLGLMIVLYFLMQGIVLSGVDPRAAEILIRVWIVGVFPILVGLGLIINGSVVSKKLLETMKQNPQAKEVPISLSANGKTSEKPSLAPADTNEFIPPGISVVEETTEQLKIPVKIVHPKAKSID